MQKRNILIVNEDTNFINEIVEILSTSNSNYYFYKANSKNSALKIAKENEIDLIIVDLEIYRINCIDLIKQIKNNKLTKAISVVVVFGALSTEYDLNTALDEGALYFIRKPIENIELRTKIRSIFKLEEYHQENIIEKNKEITENSLSLVQNNEFIEKIANKIKSLQITEGSRDILNDILEEFDDKISQISWQRFEVAFHAIHGDFCKTLLEEHSKLTKTELKLAILIKLGLSSKDISSLLYYSNESVKVARCRLRKKLKLDSKENLETYLLTV